MINVIFSLQDTKSSFSDFLDDQNANIVKPYI